MVAELKANFACVKMPSINSSEMYLVSKAYV